MIESCTDRLQNLRRMPTEPDHGEAGCQLITVLVQPGDPPLPTCPTRCGLSAPIPHRLGFMVQESKHPLN